MHLLLTYIKMDLLLPAYQKLYASLKSLEDFSKGQDLFDNISCIDTFLSEYRNITFVLQKSIAHTEHFPIYEELRKKYFKTDACSWLVTKRNEVLKEHPFKLEKQLQVTIYLSHEANICFSKCYTIENEITYSSLIDTIKKIISSIPSIEVFFSVEFIYKEQNSNINLFSRITEGINVMFAFFKDFENQIKVKPSKARKQIIDKIKNLQFYSTPKDMWFIDDYVFYKEGNVFEKGLRMETLTPFETKIPYTSFCDFLHVNHNGKVIEDTFEAFRKMHIIAFSKQKRITPTFLILNKDGHLSMCMYDSTIKTTTYRKINEIATEIKLGSSIVAVFHVGEVLVYNNLKPFFIDYRKRSSNPHMEMLAFSIITKDTYAQYLLNSDSLLEQSTDCFYPQLTEVKIDENVSLMRPLIEAFKATNRIEE